MKKVLMNKYVITVLAIAFLIGAGIFMLKREDIQKGYKHQVSSAIGLKRQVLFYNMDGKVIRRWEGRLKIEPFGAGISFLDEDGHEVKIMGPCIVEEVD